jgi:RHS repeat-associated protein
VGTALPRAFGERVAYIRLDQQEAQTAAPLALWGVEVPPETFLALAGLVLLALLGLGLRAGLLVGVARRPGYAGLAGILIVSLVIGPYPIDAGGGGYSRYLRWTLSDSLGSALTEIDEDGMITSQTRFKPFGGVDQEWGPGQRVYAGHLRQDETGLHYMKARWMDPATGTFLSVDPLIVPSDPQSGNAYTYARNNPVMNTDPTGMGTESYTVISFNMFDPSGTKTTSKVTKTSGFGSASLSGESGAVAAVASSLGLEAADASASGSGQGVSDVGGSAVSGDASSQGNDYSAASSGDFPKTPPTAQELADRRAAAVGVAKKHAGDGAEVVGRDIWMGTSGSTRRQFPSYEALRTSGYDVLAGRNIPGTNRIEIYNGAALPGTVDLAMPRGRSISATFTGMEHARFVGAHEAAHFIGAGTEGAANRQAIEWKYLP